MGEILLKHIRHMKPLIASGTKANTLFSNNFFTNDITNDIVNSYGNWFDGH